MTVAAASRHWTQDYLGLPYEKGGDTPGGFNCWGFFRHVQRHHFQIEVPLLTEPEKLSKLLRKVRDAAVALGWAETKQPRSGDAVLMAHWKHPSHCGVWVDDVGAGSVLHCVNGTGSVLQGRMHLIVAQWRIIAFYRPIHVADAGVLEVPGHA